LHHIDFAEEILVPGTIIKQPVLFTISLLLDPQKHQGDGRLTVSLRLYDRHHP
jgi:hypothetical protein